MKKCVCIIFAVFTAVLAMCACGEQPVVLDAAALADQLANNISFDDQLSEIEQNIITKIYDISPDDFIKAKVYGSTGATPEEIAVFEAKDDAAAGRIETALKERIENQKSSFKDYIPKEMPKLESPLLVIKGRCVILCISGHNDTAKNIINNAIKK